MTAVGIVGAGPGAVLHAEAVRATSGMRLAGVAASSATSERAATLAGGLDCAVLELADLARACDIAVIATPPAAYCQVVTQLAAAGRVRAVLVESPAATTLNNIERLSEALGPLPTMVGVNLLHAPAVRQFLATLASMDPHHLELRLAVPTPARALEAPAAYGGGVLMNPAAGFWPLLLAALGAPVQYVVTPQLSLQDGLDHVACVVLHATNGRSARADLRWGATIAEASLEAADTARVARVEIWPEPVLEIDGVVAQPPAREAPAGNPLAALGFTEQLRRLDRASRGEAASLPDLTAGAAAVKVAAAAAVSARRGGSQVTTAELIGNLAGLSPHQNLEGTPCPEQPPPGRTSSRDARGRP